MFASVVALAGTSEGLVGLRVLVGVATPSDLAGSSYSGSPSLR